jgi:site-specific recombinase XerD
VAAWVAKANFKPKPYLFPGKVARPPPVSTRQYARIVSPSVAAAGLDTTADGMHTLRPTQAMRFSQRPNTLRAVQWLLGHARLESTVSYLGIEVDEALETSAPPAVVQSDPRSFDAGANRA